jgi:hypothetical protein
MRKLTNEQLLDRVCQLSDIEVDQQLSEAARNMGHLDAISGRQPKEYFIARYQDDYNIGFNRGSGRLTA